MTALRRTRVGAYDVQNAYSVSVLSQMERDAAESLLLPLDSVFSDYEAVNLSPENEAHCRNGRDLSLAIPDGQYRLYGTDDQFLMFADVQSGMVRAMKRFY